MFVGEGETQFLLLAVRSPDELHVEKIESDPTWLTVSLEPMAGQREGTQLFRIRLEVPRDALPCNYRTESGWVRIYTDNAAAEEIEFKVSFAVAQRY